MLLLSISAVDLWCFPFSGKSKQCWWALNRQQGHLTNFIDFCSCTWGTSGSKMHYSLLRRDQSLWEPSKLTMMYKAGIIDLTIKPREKILVFINWLMDNIRSPWTLTISLLHDYELKQYQRAKYAWLQLKVFDLWDKYAAAEVTATQHVGKM